ncbi:hypothetical protein SRHO_G00321540 [Serrasalmus rhombeus]
MFRAPTDLCETPSIPCASIREEPLEEEVVSRFRSNTSSAECDGGVVGGREKEKRAKLELLKQAAVVKALSDPQRSSSLLHAQQTRRASESGRCGRSSCAALGVSAYPSLASEDLK